MSDQQPEQTPQTPPTEQTPPEQGTSEVEQLRARVAELEAQQQQPTDTPPTPAEPEPTLEPSGASYKRDAASQVFDGLTVELRRYEQDGLWLFGVTVNGVFLPFSQAKLGYIDTELAEAADPGHKQRVYDTYRREQLGLD